MVPTKEERLYQYAKRQYEGAHCRYEEAGSKLDEANSALARWISKHKEGYSVTSIEFQALDKRVNDADQRLNNGNQRLNDALAALEKYSERNVEAAKKQKIDAIGKDKLLGYAAIAGKMGSLEESVGTVVELPKRMLCYFLCSPWSLGWTRVCGRCPILLS